jgi:hypothetical protein
MSSHDYGSGRRPYTPSLFLKKCPTLISPMVYLEPFPYEQLIEKEFLAPEDALTENALYRISYAESATHPECH